MQKKIKIFKIGNTPEDTEKTVNAWLKENNEADILQFFPADLRYDERIAKPVLIFLYNDIYTSGEDRKRQHERVDLLDIIDYSVDGQHYRDFIEDMSESGLFIRTSHEFPAGKEVVMTFTSPELERPVKIAGEIVRTLPEGVGVRFTVKSQVQSDMIREILDRLESRRPAPA